LNEARERVDLQQPQAFVSLSLHAVQGRAGDTSTISVNQLKIPDKARKELDKARSLMEANKLDEASKRVNQALAIAPDFAEALTLRAVLSMTNNRLEEARVDLEKAVQIDPNYAMAYVVLGSDYNALERFDDAQRVLDRAIAMAPNTWQAYFELSKAALGRGDFRAALRQVNKAQDRNKRDFAPLHLVKAKALLGLRNFREAVSELESYLAKAPEGGASAEARQTLDRARAFAAGSNP
jgi:tetratricopeptide (TPR) repeat protein